LGDIKMENFKLKRQDNIYFKCFAKEKCKRTAKPKLCSICGYAEKINKLETLLNIS